VGLVQNPGEANEITLGLWLLNASLIVIACKLASGFAEVVIFAIPVECETVLLRLFGGIDPTSGTTSVLYIH